MPDLEPTGSGRPATAATLEDWFAEAHTGGGTSWLAPLDAEALVRFALSRGEGVCLMEAAARKFREPPRDVSWEILGDDAPGENWEDHRDPARAAALFRRKVDQARSEGAALIYKVWLAPGGSPGRL